MSDEASAPRKTTIGVVTAADSVAAALVDTLESIYEDHKDSELYLDALRAVNMAAVKASKLREAWNI